MSACCEHSFRTEHVISIQTHHANTHRHNTQTHTHTYTHLYTHTHTLTNTHPFHSIAVPSVYRSIVEFLVLTIKYVTLLWQNVYSLCHRRSQISDPSN